MGIVIFGVLAIVGGYTFIRAMGRKTVKLVLAAVGAVGAMILGQELVGSAMLGLVGVGCITVAIVRPKELLGGLGLMSGYLLLMVGASVIFDHLPSPLWVRLVTSILVGGLMVGACFWKGFHNSPVKAGVLYFATLTCLGTLVFWCTEANRKVANKRPVVKEMIIAIQQEKGELQELRKEQHTVTEEYQYQGESFRDSWFTIVSAACVTGLTVTDTAKFTLAGQIILLITIQAGGLGIIFFTAILGTLITRGGSSRGELDQFHADTLDVDALFVGRLLKQIFQITIVCELTATLVMGAHLQWFADPALLKGWNPWYWAAFHSISAFNNAGFSLMQDNLMSFVKDPVINLSISFLIIAGGIGYPVIIRIWVWVRVQLFKNGKRTEQLIRDLEVVQASRLQTWVCLQGTVLLLKVGTVIPLLLDWNNSYWGDATAPERVMISFFQSVSARTAGFNTVDLGLWSTAPILLFMGLMFVGACPQGTGGGIKITTFRLVLAYISNWFRAPYQDVVIKDRAGNDMRIDKDSMIAAMRIFVGSLITCWTGAFLISVFERQYLLTPDPTMNHLKVAFEVVSAFGTVGLSMGYDGAVTSLAGILSGDSKTVLIIVMLIGRLGVLTLLGLVPWRKHFGAIDLLPETKKKFQVG